MTKQLVESYRGLKGPELQEAMIRENRYIIPQNMQVVKGSSAKQIDMSAGEISDDDFMRSLTPEDMAVKMRPKGSPAQVGRESTPSTGAERIKALRQKGAGFNLDKNNESSADDGY